MSLSFVKSLLFFKSHLQNECNEVVDKYIEQDPVLTFLDALLLKIQAFRHILHNCGLKVSHFCSPFILTFFVCCYIVCFSFFAILCT